MHVFCIRTALKIHSNVQLLETNPSKLTKEQKQAAERQRAARFNSESGADAGT